MLLTVQSAGLPAFALVRGFPLSHAVLESLPPLVMAALACWPGLGRGARSALASVGLMVVSGIIVHLSGGSIEAHFHFFVMVPIVALYESWLPFGLAVGYVLIQHGVVGTLSTASVYNHSSAQQRPWTWAAIHAALFAAACLGALINWKLHERARALAVDLTRRVDHDALTGLPNRTLFHSRTREALKAAASGGDQPTVLMLDLDGFKDVNDTLGHVHGDRLLVVVAERLRSSVRADDTVGRVGGDEFAVLLPRPAVGSGEQTAQRITRALTAPFVIDGIRLDLEASIGIATAAPGEDPLTVIRHADAAMYVAKEQKLGYTTYVPGQNRSTTICFSLLGALRRALKADEIVLHYQPKIAIGTAETVGVEALARWQHPVRSLLGPEEFVPVLENTTLGHHFTAYVIRTALAQTRGWLDEGIRLPVAVNVSTRCLLDPHFPDTIAGNLLAARVPGELLCIEITEDTVMADPARTTDALRRIRALGVHISLDDFGTGYSSMAHLKILPVDELKVDKCFVRDLATEPESTAFVQSAIDLGHSLGLVIVAEGVEEASVLTILGRLGCDVAQGYHIAPPLPPDELVAWYRTTGARVIPLRNQPTTAEFLASP